MLRRDVLRLLASCAAVPLLPGLGERQLVALGRRAHESGRALRVLHAHQRAIVAVAAERIIPATETPGATDAGVAEFVDTMLADWYPHDDRDRFLAGLAELDSHARRAYGSTFVDAGGPAQTALLTSLDDEVIALRRASSPSADRHWFATLKFLTIWGYCTSETAQTDVLGLWPLPGRFDGCANV
jgi:gluconate 2-dehydrogenase gamma chain